mmetsp:Transcript_55690/g.161653  ORF Transcript_55690/g.161653 Transcript_55690/m.161653 type:complete len:218 (+) Transcript_55690:403-1056(+)
MCVGTTTVVSLLSLTLNCWKSSKYPFHSTMSNFCAVGTHFGRSPSMPVGRPVVSSKVTTTRALARPKLSSKRNIALVGSSVPSCNGTALQSTIPALGNKLVGTKKLSANQRIASPSSIAWSISACMVASCASKKGISKTFSNATLIPALPWTHESHTWTMGHRGKCGNMATLASHTNPGGLAEMVWWAENDVHCDSGSVRKDPVCENRKDRRSVVKT